MGTLPKKGLKQSLAIFGPGLIGGSIAMALRSRCPEATLTIWGRSEAALQEITRRGLADSVTTDPATAAEGADIIILCTPVGVMADLATAIAPHLGPETIVTDAGSVKASVVSQLTPILGDHFIGSHPMAGSERSGLAAARADLFSGAPCIITPVEKSLPERLEKVAAFWTALGMNITTMSPAAHDRLVARLSHLPHVLAFALVNLVASTLPENASTLAGGSYRDGTRVAASDPALWTGILMENRAEVIAALHEISALLGTFARNLEEGKSDSILDFLTQANKLRALDQRGHRAGLPLPPSENPPDIS